MKKTFVRREEVKISNTSSFQTWPQSRSWHASCAIHVFFIHHSSSLATRLSHFTPASEIQPQPRVILVRDMFNTLLCAQAVWIPFHRRITFVQFAVTFECRCKPHRHAAHTRATSPRTATPNTPIFLFTKKLSYPTSHRKSESENENAKERERERDRRTEEQKEKL